MNNILLFCLLVSAYIISPKNASAQYKSVFGDSSTSWSIVQCYQFVDGGDISDSFHTTGDTIIANSTYRKIIRTDYKRTTYAEAFMKEDTVAGKVWLRSNTQYDTSEHLVMDMNLQVGDTFPLYDYDGSIREYITVDSVFFEDGLKHIRFDALTKCTENRVTQKITFIEGIGSNAGFQHVLRRSNLLCYFKDGRKEFTSEYFDGLCKIYIVGIEENNQPIANLKLYPNPTSGKGIITFENAKNACVNLEIYGLNGKRVYTNSSKNAYITFDINAFENGVYVYKLMNEKEVFSSGRILKQ